MRTSVKEPRLVTNLLRICLASFVALVAMTKSQCQTLAPVDVSAFGTDRPLEAVFSQVSISECRGADYIKSGQSSHDNLAYDIRLSADLVFKNRSTGTVMLYKNFDPASTERVSKSTADL